MMMNPKAQALGGTALDDEEEVVPAQAETQGEEPVAEVDPQEMDAAQQKVARIQREIQLLQSINPEKALELQGKIDQLQANAAGGIPDANMLSNLELETDDAHAQENAKEGKEIQQAVGGALASLAAIGAVLKPDQLAEVLSSGKQMLNSGVSTAVASQSRADSFNPGSQVAQIPPIVREGGASLPAQA
ncbi:MAG: hypothetical protein ACN2B6_06965 [Rickettsiales bacterium]